MVMNAANQMDRLAQLWTVFAVKTREMDNVEKSSPWVRPQRAERGLVLRLRGRYFCMLIGHRLETEWWRHVGFPAAGIVSRTLG